MVAEFIVLRAVYESTSYILPYIPLKQAPDMKQSVFRFEGKAKAAGRSHGTGDRHEEACWAGIGLQVKG